ncbi:hypothetical protein H1C71_019168 [Ictidomys tridecemlineatus]|nr:hypothetical protein H1C71_019168 [Ictidomys tridecemlineatus]
MSSTLVLMNTIYCVYVCISSLSLCKIPKVNNISRGNFGSPFQWFPSFIAWPYLFEPVATWYIMAGTRSGGGPFTSWWTGSNEKKEEFQGSNIPLKGTPPMP